MCGYYAKAQRTAFLEAGSPPRVRVLPDTPNALKNSLRITPACAGTTYGYCADCRIFQDHPRVCGYYGVTPGPKVTPLGSPPRVRVLRTPLTLPNGVLRITPACAGTTGCLVNLFHGVEDHPRVCGYYISSRLVGLNIVGSPPRVRVLPE